MSNAATIRLGVEVGQDGTAALRATSAAISGVEQAAGEAAPQLDDLSTALADNAEAAAGGSEGYAELAESVATYTAAIAAAAATAAVGIYVGYSDELQGLVALTKASTEETALLQAKAMELAGAVGGPTELAKGMGDLAAAGASVNQILGATGTVAVMSAASRGTLDFAAAGGVLTDILNGAGIPIEDAATAVDMLAFSWLSASQDAKQLTDGVVGSISVFREFYGHLSDTKALEMSSAAISVLADQGFKGSEGATALNNVFIKLIGATGEGAKILEKYRDQIKLYNEDGTVRELSYILDDIANAGLSSAESLALWGADFKILNTLVAAGGDRLRDFEARVASSGGTAASAAEIMQAGLGGSIRAASAEAEKAAILFAEQFAPNLQAVLSLSELLTPAVHALQATFAMFAAGATGVAAGLAYVVAGMAYLTDAAGITVGAYESVKQVADDLAGAAVQLGEKWMESGIKAGDGAVAWATGVESVKPPVEELTAATEELAEAQTEQAAAADQAAASTINAADAMGARGADAIALLGEYDAGLQQFEENFRKINGQWVQLPDAAAVAAEGVIPSLQDIMDESGALHAAVVGDLEKVVEIFGETGDAAAEMADEVVTAAGIMASMAPALAEAAGGADKLNAGLDALAAKRVELDQLKQHVDSLKAAMEAGGGGAEMAREYEMAQLAVGKLSGEIRVLEKSLTSSGEAGEKAARRVERAVTSTAAAANESTRAVQETAKAAEAAAEKVQALADANNELAAAAQQTQTMTFSSGLSAGQMSDEQLAAAIAGERSVVAALEAQSRRAEPGITGGDENWTQRRDRIDAQNRERLSDLEQERRRREMEQQRQLDQAASIHRDAQETADKQDAAAALQQIAATQELSTSMQQVIVAMQQQSQQPVGINISVQGKADINMVADEIEAELTRRRKFRL